MSVIEPDRYFGGYTEGYVQCIAGLFVAIAALGLLPLAWAEHPLTGAVAAICAVLVLGVAAELFRGFRLKRSGSRRLHACVVVGLLSCAPLLYAADYFGPLPGLVILILFLYTGMAPRRGWLVALACGCVPNVVALLAIRLGWVAGDTLLDLVPNSASALRISLTTVVMYGSAPAVAWLTRKREARQVAALATAGREVAAHEALVREAIEERDRVAVLGDRGRFSDQSVGSFVLGPLIGRGGMGEVYEATHAGTGARAAVKLLRVAPGAGPSRLHRFEREAAIAHSLRSPFIAQVLEIGGLESSYPFIAMERLDGEDCAAILRRTKCMPLPEVVELVSHVAQGLMVAKRHHIVHRDIKPGNLHRSAEGRWKILDFGISRIAGPSGTLTGDRILGTLGYLAPEQMLGVEATHRTDVHALAAVAYRALSGRTAFVQRDLTAAIHEMREALPPRATSAQSLPAGVDDVLLIGLAKDPGDRFESAVQLAQALAQAAQGELPQYLRDRAAALSKKLSWAEQQSEAVPRERSRPRTLTGGRASFERSAGSNSEEFVRDEPRRPRQATLVDGVRDIRLAITLAVAPAIALFCVGLLAFGTSIVWASPHASVRYGGVVFLLALAVVVAAICRVARAESDAGVRRYHLLCVVSFFACSALAYFFSAYGRCVPYVALVLFAFSMTAPMRISLASLGAVALPHAALHVATTAGWISHHGMFDVTAPTSARLCNLVHVVAVYACAPMAGWVVAVHSRSKVAQVSQTFRQLVAREALLQDARLELERAAGVDQPGRLTGRTVGSFKLGNILGRGGMGDVYAATRPGDAGQYAVKLLSSAQSGRAGAAKRLEREGGIAIQLRSPNLVRVVEVGRAGRGIPYVAMERLAGQDLATLLRHRIRLPLNEVLDLVEQVSAGLRVAHAHGAVHRDLKPQNLFLTTEGIWKVLDFGATAEGGQPSGVIGTPAYMAPEQLSTYGSVDRRVDVYALGVVAYQALAGRPPFMGPDALAIALRALTEEAAPLSSVCEVPNAVDRVLRRAISKDRDERYANPVELARALREACRSRPFAVPVPIGARPSRRSTWRVRAAATDRQPAV